MHGQQNLLTYSMVQSPSWEANWCAASQEIPRISRNPKVHYRTHKRPPPVSILGQPNPVHIPTSYLLEIHPNIIHPSTPRSTQWSLSPYSWHNITLSSETHLILRFQLAFTCTLCLSSSTHRSHIPKRLCSHSVTESVDSCRYSDCILCWLIKWILLRARCLQRCDAV